MMSGSALGAEFTGERHQCCPSRNQVSSSVVLSRTEVSLKAGQKRDLSGYVNEKFVGSDRVAEQESLER